MKVLVTGAGGQLGRDVVLHLMKQGHEVMGCSRIELDIIDMDSCKSVFTSFQPEAVIHCAAYTAVDAAESDPKGAYLVNATGTGNVATAAEQIGAKLVYVSTDYVFNGMSDRPYLIDDETQPQSVYGQSKLAGEIAVRSLCSRHFIVRTSWVYGLYGNNFVKTMLRLGIKESTLLVVDDQVGSPTYTTDLAAFLHQLLMSDCYGTYHASNSGSCTWFAFSEAIFTEAGRMGFPVIARPQPCTTQQFPRPAPRPAYSVMDHSSIILNGFADLRPWQEGLIAFLEELKVTDKI